MFPFEKGDTAKPRGFLMIMLKKSSVLRTAPFKKEHRKAHKILRLEPQNDSLMLCNMIQISDFQLDQ
ncbi:hypothetical protein IJL65_02810 [bacterium]|nr:hypothetical protein [bacterium]